MSTTTLEQRVQKGMQLLDRELPRRWRTKIDLDTLSISNGSNCVLGQLYGDYDDGCFELNLDNEAAAEHGFLILEDGSYRRLNEVWKLALSA